MYLNLHPFFSWLLFMYNAHNRTCLTLFNEILTLTSANMPLSKQIARPVIVHRLLEGLWIMSYTLLDHSLSNNLQVSNAPFVRILGGLYFFVIYQLYFYMFSYYQIVYPNLSSIYFTIAPCCIFSFYTIHHIFFLFSWYLL